MTENATYKKFCAATQEYLLNLEATGAAPITVDLYSRHLAAFADFIFENDIRYEMGYPVVQAYRDSLINRNLKMTTVRQYLKELRSFFEWASDLSLGKSRWYDVNPVSKRLIPDGRKSEKRPYDVILNDDDIMKLWRNIPPRTHAKTAPFWDRNYAVVILILTTGIRNQELLALTPKDLNWKDEEITIVHGKGDKFRIVDFPLIAQTAIKLYLASGLRPDWAKDDEPLFGTQTDKTGLKVVKSVWNRGTPQWLSNLVEKHVYLVTEVSYVRTHDLRHLCARIDLNGGMSLEELQSKLGHESIATTQLYSGKLAPRKYREEAKRIYEERDFQAHRNMEKLKSLGVAV